MEPRYRLLRADKSWVRRLLAPFAPNRRFWMTYRLPFQRIATITYPVGTKDPGSALTSPAERHQAAAVIEHELHHVAQFAPWWGPGWILLAALLPLPVLFSGRWWLERSAYLHDIKSGRLTAEQAVETLWSGYGWCWPRPLMRRWFERRLR